MTRLTLAVVLIVLQGVGSHAQIATTTSLVGTVLDSSGKVVPGAAVSAINTGTHDTYNTNTNDQGHYLIQFVRIGNYELSVKHPGFRTYQVNGIQVNTNQVVRSDVVLGVGEVRETVTVESNTAAIKTDDASVSEIIGMRNIADLPLNGRDPLQFAVTTPGVILGGRSTTVPPAYTFIGAGTREIQNSLSLDGISIMSNLVTTTSARPMVETVQEVEVQTGTYSAQYGAYLGVHVNLVTKSGTNKFHGAAVEFLRNQVLDARNFFTLPTPANPTAAKPPLRMNQFGVEFDGPVIIPKLYNGKDKTFFMTSYEGLRQVQQSTSLSSQMPAAFFSGDFSAVPATSITGGVIRDPLNNNTPFPGKIIPSSRISPVPLELQRYYQPPNLPGLASNLSVPVPSTQKYNQTLNRLDQNIGDKIRLNLRAHWQKWDTYGGNPNPVNGTTVPITATNYTFGYTHALTPSLVNELRAGRNFFTRYTLNYFAVNGLKNAGTNLGIPGFDGDTRYNNPGIPEFTITGFNGLGNTGSNWYQNDSATQFSDQISWQHGAHNLMAGAEFRRLGTGFSASSTRGTFTFNGTQSGYAPADFMLGIPVRLNAPAQQSRARVATWRNGFFVLDKWQVSRKLTINYGIRYELPTVPYTMNGQASLLNRDQTALIVATPGVKFIAPNHNNWAPRLGFAYRITDKLVFRGGAGIYYNANQTNSYTLLTGNPPWSFVYQCTWSAGLPPLTLSDPFGVPAACPQPGISGASINTVPWNQPTGRMNQWSASLERQLWGGGLEIQYLGSHSYHLDRNYYNNTPLPGPGPVNSRRPNRLFGPIRTIANDVIANYESLSVIFRQRMYRGLMLISSYTWAHSLDAAPDSNGGGTSMNPYWWKGDYGNSFWDIRHRFIATFAYEIPFFAVTNPALKAAFTRWQANGIVTLRSGLPFGVLTATDTANTASGGSYRPNLVHAPSARCGHEHLIGCIDATAFTVANLYPLAPANFAYGNAGRNILRAPSSQEVNFSLLKSFPLKEQLRLQFRFEMFGLFNHPNFDYPGLVLNTASFGSITSGTGNRNVQLGAKLLF